MPFGAAFFLLSFSSELLSSLPFFITFFGGEGLSSEEESSDDEDFFFCIFGGAGFLTSATFDVFFTSFYESVLDFRFGTAFETFFGSSFFFYLFFSLSLPELSFFLTIIGFFFLSLLLEELELSHFLATGLTSGADFTGGSDFLV